MSTTLNKEETESKLADLFSRISIEDCKLIGDCLQSIVDERNEALGRVMALETEVFWLKPYTEPLHPDIAKGIPPADIGGAFKNRHKS